MSKQQPMSADDFDQSDEFDQYDDSEQPIFERLRRGSEKAPTIKNTRRQEQKEWGRAVNKFHKQRRKNGDYNKP